MSPEAKRKLSESLKGKKPWNKGVSMREESRRKLSEALKGRQAWNKGIPRSLETKAKLAAKQLGKKRSEETKRKMSEAHKKRIKETGVKPSDWGAGFGLTPWSTKKYSPTLFAYYAGLFDGEGSIMILKSGSKLSPQYGNGSEYKKIVFSLSMVDKAPLAKGYKLFGGTLHQRPGRNNGRDYWQWKIESGKQIDFLLRNIRKFLEVKGDRVDLALQYRQRLTSKINVNGRRALTKTEIETRQKLEDELKELNKRGINS